MEIKMPSKQEALYRTLHNCLPAYQNKNQGLIRLDGWGKILDTEDELYILEVGCGNGKLCDMIAKRHDAVGLDIVPGPYDRSAYKFIQHDLITGDLPINSNVFDYALCFDVLEHLPCEHVERVISEMFRVAEDVVATIACFGAGDNDRMHLTVEPYKWWLEKFKRISSDDKIIHYKVYTCEKTGHDTLLVESRDFKTKGEEE